MEGVLRSCIIAALLFLTLLVLAAAASDGDDAAAVEEQRHPLADDEPYQLVTFQNKDGEEIRLLADRRSGLVSGFANRSGHWFYSIREAGKGKRRRLLPLPESRGGSSRTEGLWNTLGAPANTTGDPDPAAADDDDDDDEERYMLVGLQTSGGDKIRLVVVADQRYVAITGFARGFFRRPNWFFREGERHRLLTSSLGNGGGSHAEVVASSVLRVMMNDGGSCMA